MGAPALGTVDVPTTCSPGTSLGPYVGAVCMTIAAAGDAWKAWGGGNLEGCWWNCWYRGAAEFRAERRKGACVPADVPCGWKNALLGTRVGSWEAE